MLLKNVIRLDGRENINGDGSVPSSGPVSSSDFDSAF